MSSIIEKSEIEVKRSFFLRTGSFEKFKCSAKYPFRLVGIKLSKDAIIELVAELIVKARILSQKAFLILFIATFKFVSVLLSLVVIVSTKQLPSKCACDNNQNKTKSAAGYYERLQHKLLKLQKHKNRLDAMKCTDDSFVSSLVASVAQPHPTSTPIKCQSSLNTSKTPVAAITTELLETQTQEVNKKFSEFEAEISKIRNLTETSRRELSTSVSNTSSLLTRLLAHKDLNKICLFPIVYGSIIVMYSQLYFLAIALNTACVPPGLIFLMASLIFVAFITFKVFFIEKFRKVDNKPNSRETTYSKQSAEIRPLASIEATTNLTDNQRQSRTRVKRIIDLNSKTLSKVKLL